MLTAPYRAKAANRETATKLYNVITCTKKLCMATAPVVQKKSDYRVYCAYSDYCAKKTL